MTMICLYLAFGLLNATDAYARNILMIAFGIRDWEAWVELVLYILLWPIQAIYYVCSGIWRAMDWCQAKIWGA